MNYLKDIWFNYFEPKQDYICEESREAFKNCVAESECFTNTNNFKLCATTNIDNECKSIRNRYSACKRLCLDRTKDFRLDERKK